MVMMTMKSFPDAEEQVIQEDSSRSRVVLVVADLAVEVPVVDLGASVAVEVSAVVELLEVGNFLKSKVKSLKMQKCE